MVIDSIPIESGDIMDLANIGMKIRNYKEQLPMCVPRFGHYAIIGGIPGLQRHDVALQFVLNLV